MTTLERLKAEPTTILVRELEDGRILALRRLFFGVQLTVSSPESLAVGVIDDAWDYAIDGLGVPDYDALGRAILAITCWDGEDEPEDWTRHSYSGRRRPGGDPEAEYVHR